MVGALDKIQQRKDYLNVVRFIKTTRNRLRSSSLEPVELRRLLTGALHLLRAIMGLPETDFSSPFDYKKTRSDLEEICREIRNYNAKSSASKMSFEAANEEGSHITEVSEQEEVRNDSVNDDIIDTRFIGKSSASVIAVEKNNNNNNDTTSAERIQMLLQQQKHISAQELDEEKRCQVALTTELAELTGILKEATIQMNRSVVEQNQQLESIQHHAGDNLMELENQKKKMNEREKKMRQSVFSSIGSMFWVVVLFIVTYAIIRLFPKPATVV